MADDTLKSFLVSIGFAVDDASRKQAEAAVSQSEAKLTDSTIKELVRRRNAEDKALADRVNAITAVGGELDAEEKAAAARFVKTQAERADKDRKIQEDAAKKTRERRDGAFKEAQKYALQFAAFASKIALAVEASALGIVAVTDKAAKSFENLNYLSQRTGGSPKAITSFAYAISQLGGTVEGATSSFEAFATKLTGAGGRGLEQMLNNLGVKTRDAAGNLRDAGKIAGEAVQELGRRPIAESQAYAQVFGFDDLTRRAGADPRLGQFEAQHDADQAKIGADPNAAAAGGTQFEQHMRRLEDVANDVATKVETNLFKKIQPLLDKLADWIVEHGQDIATVMSDIADKLVRFATAMGDAFTKVDWDGVLKSIDHFFTEFDRLARQYFGKDGLTAVFEAFGLVLAGSVLTKLTGMIAALQTLSGIPLFTRLLSFLGVGGAAGAAAAIALAAAADHENILQPPASSSAEDIGNSIEPGLGSGVRRAYNWAKGKLGFGGSDNTHVSPSGPHSRYGGSNFNKENANSIVSAAKELGTTPEDLATVIGYESGFDPSKWGGAGGKYMGLIQMGPSERAQFGANENQSFPEQMGAVVRYLKGRGFKPGMGLMDLYSTINAGSPGHYGASDGHGTVASHVANMQGATAAQARAMLALADAGDGTPTTAARRGQTSLPPNALYWGSDSTGKSVAIDAQGRAIGADGKPTTANMPTGGIPKSYDEVAAYAANLMKQYRTTPSSPRPLGDTPALQSSIMYDQSRTRGDVNVTHSPTFNVQGSDVTANLRAAQLAAGRGVPDWLRNMQGAGQ